MNKHETLISWEAVCEKENRDPKVLPEVSMLPEAEQRYQIATFKLPHIIKAINKCFDEKFKVDFSDWGQEKWYPIPVQEEDKSQPSGCGLSLDAVGYTDANTDVGARFAYCNEEATRFGFKNFKQLYIDMQLEF